MHVRKFIINKMKLLPFKNITKNTIPSQTLFGC